MTANHGVTELKAILDHYNDVLSEDDKSTALGEWCDYKALLNANPNLREMSKEQVFGCCLVSVSFAGIAT